MTDIRSGPPGTVLVVGRTGLIGSAIIARLKAGHVRVIATARDAGAAARRIAAVMA